MKNIGVISGKPYIYTRNHRSDEILYIVKALKLRFSKASKEAWVPRKVILS